MAHWLLTINVIDGPLPFAVWGLTIAALVVLAARRRKRRTLRRVVAVVVAGVVVGAGAVLMLNATLALGSPLPGGSAWWAGGCLAAMGLAITSLWDARTWRRVLAGVTLLLVLASTALGANAMFGIERTIGDVLDISTLEQADQLPAPQPDDDVDEPLYLHWSPPTDMPKAGEVLQLSGDYAIPSTAGFVPRDASIYLPPAALVEDPPDLPVVVHMMGKPGAPNPEFVQDALDAMAAKHSGLAPIVIVADQLGDPDQNPGCVDSTAFGGVATYFNEDIPAYIRGNLNVIEDPVYWSISGYSNGGACAFTWAAQHPELWGNLISISGEEYAGTEEPDTVLEEVFHDDAGAYEASRPAAQLTKNAGRFDGHVAVFTAGERDTLFVEQAERSAVLAEDAGFTTTAFIVPGADHVASALQGGLAKAFDVLYPHLGLAPPAR